jgi:hypothetical protein
MKSKRNTFAEMALTSSPILNLISLNNYFYWEYV